MKNYYFALQVQSGLPYIPFCGTFDQASEYLDVLAANTLDDKGIPYRRESEQYYVCKDCGEVLEDNDLCVTCGCTELTLAPLFEDQCFNYLDMAIYDTDEAGFRRLGGK